MTRSLIVLALAWVTWCVVHSLLVAGPARLWLESRLGARASSYRLLYNLLALVSLIPVLLYARAVDGPVVFTWGSAAVAVDAALVLLALFFFYAGAQAYDMATFLGLRQLRAGGAAAGSTSETPGDDSLAPGPGLHQRGGLSRRGILGVVRHPWYTGGLLLLWAGPKNAAALVTAAVLTGYLILGAYLEERRLLAEFGAEYRRYRREVSMFFPFRWVRGR